METRDTVTTDWRTPTLFRIVAVLSLLWNGYGALNYVMTRMRNMDYLAAMGGDPAQMLAYIDSFPLWAQAGWGLGVWGGVAGAIMLLVRSRVAVAAFGLSLVGMTLSFGYQFLGPPAPPEMSGSAGAIVPIVIIVLGIAQLLYARRMLARGVLR
ncbi:MAG: hypothetical protein M3Q83_02930 [Pseudomonadota bacterium]|nr:hypothetical protein [Pseudomonadota bacterium]